MWCVAIFIPSTLSATTLLTADGIVHVYDLRYFGLLLVKRCCLGPQQYLQCVGYTAADRTNAAELPMRHESPYPYKSSLTE